MPLAQEPAGFCSCTSTRFLGTEKRCTHLQVVLQQGQTKAKQSEWTWAMAFWVWTKNLPGRAMAPCLVEGTFLPRYLPPSVPSPACGWRSQQQYLTHEEQPGDGNTGHGSSERPKLISHLELQPSGPGPSDNLQSSLGLQVPICGFVSAVHPRGKLSLLPAPPQSAAP
mmetsp:Transcript_10277/g.18157  ORF Transcript_10277/g.18157 Transcript_10277/m.18157 type:complete len:168 (+) Transcript_10277:350-853(+)